MGAQGPTAGQSVSGLPGLAAAQRLPWALLLARLMPCALSLSSDVELGEHASSLKGRPWSWEVAGLTPAALDRRAGGLFA